MINFLLIRWSIAAGYSLVLSAVFHPAKGVAAEKETCAEPRIAVTVTVVDVAASPKKQLRVFVADALSNRIVDVASSDPKGEASFCLRARKHNIGIFSRSLFIQTLKEDIPGQVVATVGLRKIPHRTHAFDPTTVYRFRARMETEIVRGVVKDEAKVGVGGIRINIYETAATPREIGALVLTVFSLPDGGFSAPVLAGTYDFVATAPGLVMLSASRDSEGRLGLVMAIDASEQTVSVNSGKTLTFRVEDSVDPPYYPPAPVRAWLCSALGIAVPNRPLGSDEKRNIRQYWWLAALRSAPDVARVGSWREGACGTWPPKDGLDPVGRRLQGADDERLFRSYGGQ